MDHQSTSRTGRPLPWARTTEPEPATAAEDIDEAIPAALPPRWPSPSERAEPAARAPRSTSSGRPRGADLEGDDDVVTDPYPEDNRPSRRRPTISGRPFEPWLAAGDRLPPPGGYGTDGPGARAAARRRPDRRATAAAARRGPGRPRNADAEQKAFGAVLDLFGQRGWAGLSLDAVAAEAGLGKSSIYLRWTDKQALLIDALQHIDLSVVTPEGEAPTSVRDMLVHAAHRRIAQYGGVHGPAIYRLNIEARVYPEIFATIWEETVGASIRELSAALLRNAEGAHQPTEQDATDLIASVEGTALYLEFVAHPASPPSDAELHDRIERMVDRHLRGIREHLARRAHGQDR